MSDFPAEVFIQRPQLLRQLLAAGVSELSTSEKNGIRSTEGCAYVMYYLNPQQGAHGMELMSQAFVVLVEIRPSRACHHQQSPCRH